MYNKQQNHLQVESEQDVTSPVGSTLWQTTETELDCLSSLVCNRADVGIELYAEMK